ncbi:MAG: LamG domain-containing protein [Nitrosospira sp.]
MGLIALPQRFTSQPQYVPRLAEAYQDAELLSLFNDGSGQDIAKGNHLIPGVAPSPAARQHGKTLSFDGSSQYLLSTRTIAPGTQFTVFAWVRPAALNISYRRIVETAYDTGFYLGSNTGSQYAWIVNNALLEGCIGGQQVAGQRDFVCGVFDGANRILYVNGVQVASSTAASPSAAIQVSISRWTAGSGGYYWNGDIDTVGVFNRAFPASEIWSLYQDPWRLLKAPPRRLWPAGSSNLTGATSIQTNAGSIAAIAQVCALTGAASSQVNISGSVAVTIDANIHVVGAASTQANISSTAPIAQVCVLTSAASFQVNTSGSIAVTIDANIHVVGAASTQANISSTAAINQAHVLLVSTSAQVNSSTAITFVQSHVLTGAASTQGNLGGSGAISIVNEFVSAPSTQANFSGTGQISRAQTLSGANSTQANLSGTGTISDGIVVEPSLTSGIAETIRIKKPGIPAGTPEWLKTMIETLTGRRGNRIEAPKFQTLTFSATPTRTECEALYSYLNTVRDALEQLISRMDG